MVLVALLLTAPTIYASSNLQNRTKWGAKTGDTVEELRQENMMMREMMMMRRRRRRKIIIR